MTIHDVYLAVSPFPIIFRVDIHKQQFSSGEYCTVGFYDKTNSNRLYTLNHILYSFNSNSNNQNESNLLIIYDTKVVGDVVKFMEYNMANSSKIIDIKNKHRYYIHLDNEEEIFDILSDFKNLLDLGDFNKFKRTKVISNI